MFFISLLDKSKCLYPVQNSSLPEVANNAALYFDADEVDSIKNKMEIFLDNFEIKAKLINDGLENIKQFSWENCANKTLDVYKKKN